jgi:TDG/mug DNA glycosylase family protein
MNHRARATSRLEARPGHDGQSLPDVLDVGLRVVFCGINPGLRAAKLGWHFANRSNRFWKVLFEAGFTPHQIDPREDRALLDYGYGLTTASPRPTARADQLCKGEIAQAAGALEAKIHHFEPRMVAFLGKKALAEISGRSVVTWGEQEGRFGGARVWVVPNPSGLNRSFSVARLVCAYRALYDAAHLKPVDDPTPQTR